MAYYYTSARNIQIVIALMKSHGIKRVVTSPGATDLAINFSLQHDPYFELYSCIDERSAAYMACGMAAETGGPVAITCTGATSSRNYMPGLTEAFYRHLPILAITCSRSNSQIGHMINQVTDRTVLPNDIAKVSVQAQAIDTADDEWDVMTKVNKAILGLRQNGGGPCHINLEYAHNADYSIKEIAPVRVINRYTLSHKLPEIKAEKTAIFVGAHHVWTSQLTAAVEKFCEIYNGVVLCDATSNYRGKYEIRIPLICEQMEHKLTGSMFDLMIHIGDVSSTIFDNTQEIWRVAEDGALCDTFQRLKKIFQMSEIEFFTAYSKNKTIKCLSNYENIKAQYDTLYNSIPELPFSNVYAAQKLAYSLPNNSVIHLGIRNSLRSWGYWQLNKTISSFSNTGGFGIDGGISSLIGASMINRNKLYFGVFGDLLFYYDMNSLGNRDISSNIRILIVNNGLGQEFKNYSFIGSTFGEETDLYIAAKGHYINGTKDTIRRYAESVGFEYLSASNKEEFITACKRFLIPTITEKPMLFELQVTSEDENKAHELITTLSSKSKAMKKAQDLLQKPAMKEVKNLAKQVVKTIKGK